MNQPVQPQPANVALSKAPDYRETYANSVQVRANLWDFLLTFGTMEQTAPDSVTINSFQGIYLSPQQAKALANLLRQNIEHYESMFGEIRLQPKEKKGQVQ